MIKKRIICALIVSTCLPLFLFANPTINFYKNVTSAKEAAKTEGKLYFIDFVASWCMPCRWMDETTYSDPTLASYIDKNYVPIKVDIDDFDGYSYKQQYKIELLPTILIFNSSGKLVGRYEESMSPSHMLELLQKYNTPANRVRFPSSVVNVPNPNKAKTTTTTTKVVIAPTLPEEKINIKRAPLPKTINPKAILAKNVVPAGDGLYRLDVSPQASKGFSVQIGVFDDYNNILRKASEIETLFKKPIIMHVEKSAKGLPVYKMLIGEFKNKDDAAKFVKVVKSKKIDAIVKDLTLLK